MLTITTSQNPQREAIKQHFSSSFVVLSDRLRLTANLKGYSVMSSPMTLAMESKDASLLALVNLSWEKIWEDQEMNATSSLEKRIP